MYNQSSVPWSATNYACNQGHWYTWWRHLVFITVALVLIIWGLISSNSVKVLVDGLIKVFSFKISTLSILISNKYIEGIRNWYHVILWYVLMRHSLTVLSMIHDKVPILSIELMFEAYTHCDDENDDETMCGLFHHKRIYSFCRDVTSQFHGLDYFVNYNELGLLL